MPFAVKLVTLGLGAGYKLILLSTIQKHDLGTHFGISLRQVASPLDNDVSYR